MVEVYIHGWAKMCRWLSIIIVQNTFTMLQLRAQDPLLKNFTIWTRGHMHTFAIMHTQGYMHWHTQSTLHTNTVANHQYNAKSV